jgi:hypothetical protein
MQQTNLQKSSTKNNTKLPPYQATKFLLFSIKNFLSKQKKKTKSKNDVPLPVPFSPNLTKIYLFSNF